MTWGVTDTGFVKKILSDILSEIEADEKDLISAALNVLPTSVLGQLNGIFGDKLRELWDVAEAVYRSQSPDYASGDSLDQVAAMCPGINRLRPQKGTVTLDQIFLDGSASVPAGSIVSIGELGERLITLATLTNPQTYPQTLSVAAEFENFGVIPGYANTINNIVTPVAGWNAKAAVTCSNSETYNLDGNALAIYVNGSSSSQVFAFSGGDPWSAAAVAAILDAGANNGAVAAGGKVRAWSDLDGPGSSIRFSGSAATILGFPTTVVEGFNTADAELGRLLETDAEFRLRREQQLAVTGASTIDAIRAKILTVLNVLQCYVFENTSLVTVGGIPGKAFESVVQGGDDQEIADAIFSVKPAGMEAYGTTTKSVTDSQGFVHNVSFSRPTTKAIYIDATVDAYSSQFPTDGITQIKNALKALGDTQQIGEDVIALQYKSVPLDISGVEDVSIFEIDDVDPPVGTTNITIGSKELATFAVVDIDITMNWL